LSYTVIIQSNFTTLYCYILHRNYHLKHAIEGKIEVVGRQGRRCTKVLDDLKKKRGCYKFKEEVLYHTVWRT